MVDLLKLFWHNLLTIVSKLDHFTNVNNTCQIELKKSRFEQRVCIFTPKRFMRYTPRGAVFATLNFLCNLQIYPKKLEH
jgi:hypothetical protein